MQCHRNLELRPQADKLGKRLVIFSRGNDEIANLQDIFYNVIFGGADLHVEKIICQRLGRSLRIPVKQSCFNSGEPGQIESLQPLEPASYNSYPHSCNPEYAAVAPCEDFPKTHTRGMKRASVAIVQGLF